MNRCTRWRARFAALVVVAGLALPASARAQKYQPIDLGSLGGTEARAFGLSTNTQIVGSSALPSGKIHAFRWVAPGPPLDLKTLGGPESRAISVNLAGHVAGWSDLPDGTWQAFLWDSAAGMRSIGTLGGRYSEGYGITNGDVVVGWAETGSGSWEAFVWDSVNRMRSLGTLGGEFSQALSINRAGKIVGGSQDVDGNWQAFLWDPVTHIRPLGFLGGDYSSANDINLAGFVVGSADLADGTTNAFLWDGAHGMRSLGSLGGAYSDAAAINASNQVVGTSTRASGNAHAFIWDSFNGMRDLNTLIPANSGWELLSAEGINDLGEIIGYGFFNGHVRAFYLTVGPTQLAAVTLTPPNVPGGQDVAGAVSLSGPAPSGGVSVTLSSNDPVAQIAGATTIVIPPGSAGANFTIHTTPVTSSHTCQITAQAGTETRVGTLVVRPVGPKSITLNPTSVEGGDSASGTVTLEAPATPGFVTVTLSGAGAASPNPASITIPPGETTGTFTVNTSPVAVTEVDAIKATTAASGIVVSSNLTVLGPEVASLTLDPSAVAGGFPSTGTVTTTIKAPPGGLKVQLGSSNTAVATTPVDVTVPEGLKTATFTINTKSGQPDTTVTITASLAGKSKTASLSVRKLALNSISANPRSVFGGKPSTGTVTLTVAAPAGGFTVNLSSSDSATASVPATAKVPAGETSVDFPISTGVPPVQKTVTISASALGATVTTSLTVKVPDLATLQVKPGTVSAGDTAIGTVTLTGPALVGGYLVNLSSADTSVATVPASVIVPEGDTSATFPIAAKNVVGTRSTTINATHGPLSKSASLQVTSVKLTNLTVDPSSIASGENATGRVTLSGAAPSGGYPVDLDSSNSGIASVPASVIVPAGKTFVEFTVAGQAVLRDASAIISATNGSTTKSATVAVKTWRLTSFTLNPTTVKGGTPATGTLTISSPAPAGGVTVLVSVYAGPVSVPAMVQIPAGKTSATFSVTTQPADTTQYATIQARGGATTLTVNLTITP